MITKDQIARLAEEKLTGTDVYLVDVMVNVGNKISVEIDRDKGINIQDCVAVSRHIENNLDREEEDFELQVSSPGLDQPFKIIRQYYKNMGRQVQVVLKDGNKFAGKLLSVNEGGIELEIQQKENKKSKKYTMAVMQLSFDQIKETKVVISFKNQ